MLFEHQAISQTTNKLSYSVWLADCLSVWLSVCLTLALSLRRMPRIVTCSDLKSADFDGVVVVTDTTSKLTGDLQPLADVLNNYAKVGGDQMVWYAIAKFG